MINATLRIFRLSDTLLVVGEEKPLTDESVNPAVVITDTAYPSATVSATIHDKGSGTQVGAGVTLSHVASGKWQGVVADDHADLVEGQPLIIKLTVLTGTGVKLYRELDGVARVDRG